MEIFINKAKACAISGNRKLPENFDKENLEKVLLKIIDTGFDTFLVGMALGFDTECFHVLEKIRTSKSIKIIACIPCVNQSEKFTDSQKVEYRKMIDNTDGIFVISQEYSRECMMKRNKYMIDHASLLLAYSKQNYGGTFSTIKYAVSKNIPIIEL